MNQQELESFNKADKRVHKVEEEWHYPIFIKYGYEPIEKEGIGFVRSYDYVHKERGNKIQWTTGCNRDYWKGSGGYGLWADLEPYLEKLDKESVQCQTNS